MKKFLPQQLANMTDSLSEALAGCGILYGDSSNNIAICDAPETSAQFLTTQFLCRTLEAGKHVMFLSLHHTFAHNCNIAAKRGVKLINYYKSGAIKVIEGQKLMSEAAAKLLEGQVVSKHPFNFMFNNSDHSLKNLFLSIKFCVEEWRSTGVNFVLFIDNLSMLLSLGISSTEIRIFLQYCSSLLYSLSGNGEADRLGNMIIVTQNDEHDKDTRIVASYLMQSFDVTLSLRPLSTGKTSEVDGNLEISSWHQSKRLNKPVTKLYLYKVLEKSTKLFAPGMASSVL